MSRTDVHRPYRIQINDPDNRHRTRLSPTWAFLPPEPFPLYGTCGCHMCTGHNGRIANNGRRRAAWRRFRQELLKARFEDLDDVDVVIHVAEAWF